MAGTQAVSFETMKPGTGTGTASAKGTKQDMGLDFGSCMTQQTEKKAGKISGASKDAKLTAGQKVNLRAGNTQLTQSRDVQSDTAKQAASVVQTQEPMAQDTLEQADQSIKDLLQDVLQTSDEVISTLMTQMQIQPVQLLDPPVLQDFVMQFNGQTDSTAFLTDASMLTQLAEITDGLQDIADRMNLTTDDFMQLLQEQTGQTVVRDDGLMDAAADVVTEWQPEQTQPQTVSGQPQAVIAATADPVTAQTEVTDAQQAEMENDSVQEAETTQNVGMSASQEDASQNASQESSSDDMAGQGGSQGTQYTVRTAADTQGTIQPMTTTEFAGQLVQATETTEAVPETNMQQMVDIVNQVVERIHTHVQEDTTTMQLQLNPESLGKVLLSVSNKNGVMTASFTVQTNEAREALENQMFVLRENLEQKNLKVESVEVSVSDFDFSQNSQMDAQDQKGYEQGNGRRAPMQFEEAEEETAEEPVQPGKAQNSAMQMSGSNIDYTA